MKKAKRKKINKKNKISNFIISFSLIILLIYTYVDVNIKWSSLDQLIFSIQNAEGTSADVIKGGVKFVIKYYILIILIYNIITYVIRKRKLKEEVKIYLKINKKKYKIYPLDKCVKALIIFFITLIYIYLGLGITDYIKNIKEKSNIFEEEYVDPKEVNIEFEEKRNLIYIFVESLENSALSINNGGIEEESYIPNLEELALNNENFSNTEKIGGSYVTSGSTWTAGAMVSQTSGVPLKTGSTSANEYKLDNFLSGAYSLGEVLKENGYKNYLMLGSDATFGGRKYYFSLHGNYEILDYNWARDNKLIPEDYFIWWGYEDSKLFKFAENKLTEISKNEPFNFTLLTADTHFIDGYVDSTCEEKFDSQYANSYYCTDKMIGEFIDWIKEQDFYENTTVIIVGDHLTMQTGFFDDTNYNRTVYNVIINGKKYDNVIYKNRLYSTLDLYPTTIASIGGNIDGDRLGLGTNLYSEEKTLIEKYGLEYINSELSKNSDYYNHNLLKGDYIELNN